MKTDYEAIVSLLRLLPESAVAEVADFTGYLLRKHTQFLIPLLRQVSFLFLWATSYWHGVNWITSMPLLKLYEEE